MRRTAWVAVIGLMLYAVTGCTSGDDATTVPAAVRTSPAPTQPSTDLRIVITAPGQPMQRFALTCDPAGGDHPSPATACGTLRRLDAPFAEAPADRACTEIYGGPQVAVVTGFHDRRQVSARFTRTDGCQIARWDRLADVLVERGGANGS